jgi:hypothetical protein
MSAVDPFLTFDASASGATSGRKLFTVRVSIDSPTDEGAPAS